MIILLNDLRPLPAPADLLHRLGIYAYEDQDYPRRTCKGGEAVPGLCESPNSPPWLDDGSMMILPVIKARGLVMRMDLAFSLSFAITD